VTIVEASAPRRRCATASSETKDGLKSAPGFTYDKASTTWVPEVIWLARSQARRVEQCMVGGFMKGPSAVPTYADLAVLGKADLAPEWQGERPILCIAGRTLLDEAAAIMFAQLCTAHGLAARVEESNALTTTIIFRLETAGVALICLSYLDTTNAAHIRYAIRRIRRKLPRAIIMVGCWTLGDDEGHFDSLREGTRADLVCASFRDATRLCVEAAKLIDASSDGTKGASETADVIPFSNLTQGIS